MAKSFQIRGEQHANEYSAFSRENSRKSISSVDEDSDGVNESQPFCNPCVFSMCQTAKNDSDRLLQKGKEKWDIEVMDKVSLDDASLDYWRKTNGLHTVKSWCESYNDHPAGWGALLMIHGIPEVTGRLRSKVESFAIYAALFVSGSVATLVNPPSEITKCDSQGEHFLHCQVIKRIFIYSLVLSLIAHIFCIFLAIAFCNALNEAARDADVIRIFAYGQGFRATAKCQNSFFLGVALNLASVVVMAYTYLGLEVCIVMLVVVLVAVKMYIQTTGLLFGCGSIVTYWREQAHEDDPYDLSLPLACLQKRVEDGWTLVSTANDGPPANKDCAENLSALPFSTMRRNSKTSQQSTGMGSSKPPPRPRYKLHGVGGMNKQAHVLPLL